MPPPPRPLTKTLVSLAALVALAAPVTLAVALGWIEIRFAPWGDRPEPSSTPIEAWVLLALAYVVWTPAVFVALVLVLDRLGHKYTPAGRDRRPTRKERRRVAAGISVLQADEAPRAGAPRARPGRGADPSAQKDGR
jgi:hypothetical protein